MSPVSRGRKKPKSRQSGERVLRVVAPAEPAELPECDCPDCTGAEITTAELADGLVAGGADLLEVDDPIEAELFGADFLAIGELAGEGFADALGASLVPAIEQVGTPEAVAALLALDAVDEGPAAGAAAARLLATGVPAPKWAAELREPLSAGACRRLADPAGDVSVLVCVFSRAGRSHGLLVDVDHTDCDAATDVALFPAEMFDEVLHDIRHEASTAGVTLTTEEVDPGEFRWQVERALDARAVHDQEDGGVDVADDDLEPDGAGYHLLAVLARAWMRTLPDPPRPPAPH
jgi:hypothetical protein